VHDEEITGGDGDACGESRLVRALRQGDPQKGLLEAKRGARRAPNARGERLVPIGTPYDERCVARELEDVTARVEDLGHHPAEVLVQELRDVLRAHGPPPREALGDCGEARDVGEENGAPDGLTSRGLLSRGLGEQPLEHDAGEVTFHRIGWSRVVNGHPYRLLHSSLAAIVRGSPSSGTDDDHVCVDRHGSLISHADEPSQNLCPT
jgi:hypothetical protein